MSPDAIERIAEKADTVRLAIGTGRDAPDPREVRLEHHPTSTVEDLAAEPDPGWPADWAEQVATWPRPSPGDLFEIIFTSGTTGTPKGVMLSHANILGTIETAHNAIPPQEHRLVSLLPLSHIMEQAIALFYAMTVGADILYVRSRNPRVIFEAIRDHRVTTMLVVPQVLDLFWGAIEREVDKSGRTALFERLRLIARHLPYGARRFIFRTRPRPARRRPQPVRVRRGVPAAGAPAGLGGRRRRRHAGLRGHRVRPGQRDLEDRPRARDRGPDDPAGRGQARRRRRDPGQGPDRLRRLLARPRGDRGLVHRRRLVPDRRHRPPRRGRPPHPHGPDQGHHRPAERAQRVPRGHRERAPDRRASATRSSSRRSPAGSRRSSSPRARRSCPAAATCPARASRGSIASPRSCASEIDAAVKRGERDPRPRTSASSPGGSGRTPTSRGPTRSRSSASGSAPGRSSSSRSRSRDDGQAGPGDAGPGEPAAGETAAVGSGRDEP